MGRKKSKNKKKNKWITLSEKAFAQEYNDAAKEALATRLDRFHKQFPHLNRDAVLQVLSARPEDDQALLTLTELSGGAAPASPPPPEPAVVTNAQPVSSSSLSQAEALQAIFEGLGTEIVESVLHSVGGDFQAAAEALLLVTAPDDKFSNVDDSKSAEVLSLSELKAGSDLLPPELGHTTLSRHTSVSSALSDEQFEQLLSTDAVVESMTGYGGQADAVDELVSQWDATTPSMEEFKRRMQSDPSSSASALEDIPEPSPQHAFNEHKDDSDDSKTNASGVGATPVSALAALRGQTTQVEDSNVLQARSHQTGKIQTKGNKKKKKKKKKHKKKGKEQAIGQVKGKHWECTKCTFINTEAVEECIVCGLSLSPFIFGGKPAPVSSGASPPMVALPPSVRRPAAAQFPSPAVRPVRPASGNVSLVDIMNEQQAKQESLRTIPQQPKRTLNSTTRQSSVDWRTMEREVGTGSSRVSRWNTPSSGNPTSPVLDLSSQLKLDRLKQSYPNISTDDLTAVLVSCHSKLDLTIAHLSALFPMEMQKTDPKELLQGPLIELSNEERVRQRIKGSEVTTEVVTSRGVISPHQQPDSMDFLDIDFSSTFYSTQREKASKLHARQAQIVHRAAEYHSAGQYVQMRDCARRSRALARKIQEANTEAMKHIFAQNNKHNNIYSVVDLHGLYRTEAIQVIGKILKRIEQHRQTKGNNRSPRKLSIITGTASSKMTEARLFPAISAFLRSRKYNFSCPQAGVICVDVT